MGELDVKLGDVKATYVRQVLEQLQQTTQKLRETETTLGPARKLLDIKAEDASGVTDEADYVILINRVKQGRLVNFDATSDTTLLPGDVVEVKRKKPHTDIGGVEFSSTGAVLRDLSVAEGSVSPSR
jgi:hypothetical protein